MAAASRNWVFLAAALLALGACKSGRSEADLWASPPPVVPGAPTFGVIEAGQDHSHATTNTSSVPAERHPVAMRAALSHKLFSKSSPARMVLKVDLQGLAQGAPSRQPLNLALVIDRSGSMNEDQKFARAMEAARLVVENLSDRDIISLIVFNDRALVLSPAGRAVNKDFLYYRLGQFGPEGATILSAGMLEAFAQIDSKKADEQLKRIIVLTDGLANRGVTDSGKLQRMVETAHEKGIGVSTFGCGVKFDENLLTALAKAGGGRYTYVRDSEQIPAAISAEVDGLLDVVAQNVKLDIKATDASKITRVYGRLIDQPILAQAFTLGDIRAGENSVFLLELAAGSRSALSAEVKLTIDNPQTGSRERQVLSLQAEYSDDSEQVRNSQNKSVVMYARVLDAMEKAEEAIQGLDAERFREARRLFDLHYEDARRHARESRDQQLLNQTFLLRHFMAELAATGESALLHGHPQARARIQKSIDYRR